MLAMEANRKEVLLVASNCRIHYNNLETKAKNSICLVEKEVKFLLDRSDCEDEQENLERGLKLLGKISEEIGQYSSAGIRDIIDLKHQISKRDDDVDWPNIYNVFTGLVERQDERVEALLDQLTATNQEFRASIRSSGLWECLLPKIRRAAYHNDILSMLVTTIALHRENLNQDGEFDKSKC